jgi:Fe-S-cluster containining protein
MPPLPGDAVPSPDDAPSPNGVPGDCTRCGTCCFSESPRHVRVTGSDYERLGDDADTWVHFLENTAYMALTARDGVSHCVALTVDPESLTYLCSIYSKRPQICRELERGSPACEGELATKRERPRRTLALIRAPRSAGLSTGRGVNDVTRRP